MTQIPKATYKPSFVHSLLTNMDSTFQENMASHFITQVKEYAIFAMDTKGIITTWNEGVERIKGYSEEEFVGKYFGMLFTDEDQQKELPKQELEQAKRDGLHETEGWRKKKDGSHFWAGIALTPVYDNEKKLIGYTKVTNDLTDKKKQEQDLSRKNEVLNKTNKDLDTFIYTASHDLKAPILNIDGLINRLTRTLEVNEVNNADITNLIKRIENSISRFKGTIEDLTTISKLQRSIDEESNEEQVNIQEVYEDIMDDLSFLFEEFTCDIITDFEVKSLAFSRKNFRSILYNLISNAFKYRTTSGCSIEMKTNRVAGYVLLTIKDNGLGMSEANQEQLFTMFKRFHPQVEGSGIGLYIVKRLLDNGEGRIEVDSKEGEGTEFRVYFKDTGKK